MPFPRMPAHRVWLAAFAAAAGSANAQDVEVVARQRLFGQCSALVIAARTLPCSGVNLVHNLDGRSYFEIPTGDVTVLIGGQRELSPGRMALRVDSIDPGTGTGETAVGECTMQTSPTDTLLGLTCRATGSNSGSLLFVYKPSEQKIDGKPPRV